MSRNILVKLISGKVSEEILKVENRLGIGIPDLLFPYFHFFRRRFICFVKKEMVNDFKTAVQKDSVV